jgi:hypothetical protein
MSYDRSGGGGRAFTGPDDVAMIQGAGGYQAPPSTRERTMKLLQIRKDALLDRLASCPPGDPARDDLAAGLSETKRLIAEVRTDALGPGIYDLLDDLERCPRI